MKRRKTWREKMQNPSLPKLVPIPPKMERLYGSGKMLIPSPLEVETYMRAIPKGSVATISRMRADLAEKHSADVTCPLTSGIFIRIAAEAAEEDARLGTARITPYWRMVKDDGSLNPKLPGGVEAQAAKLRKEGHRIEPGKGAKPPRIVLGEKGQKMAAGMPSKLAV